jgi:O-antigen/teichoic acid export membrane protein
VSRGILAALVGRGLYVVAPLVTIPISLQHLGASDYGAWSAALALTAITSFADLGLGVGLMTRLAAALTDRDLGRARVLVTSAYGVATGIVAVLLAALWGSAAVVDWAALIGGRGQSDENIVLVTLSVFLFNVVAGLIVRVQYAAQQVALSNAWQSAASLMGIAGVLAAVALDVSSPVFVLIAGASQTAVTVINTLWFFSRGGGRQYRMSPRAFNGAEGRALIGLGSRFLFITVLISLTMSTDPLIISHTASLTAVTEYAIPAKIFSMLATVVSALSIPLWTANVEALRLGEWDWVQRITRKMTLLSGGVVLVLSGVAVLIAPWVIRTWLGGRIEPSVVLMVGLGLVALVQAVAAPIFMVQNAAEVLRPQTLGYLLLLLILPAKWLVVSAFGFEWIPWVTGIGYCLVVWPAAWIGYRRVLRVRAGS